MTEPPNKPRRGRPKSGERQHRITFDIGDELYDAFAAAAARCRPRSQREILVMLLRHWLGGTPPPSLAAIAEQAANWQPELPRPVRPRVP